jgi:hypothetical protein
VPGSGAFVVDDSPIIVIDSYGGGYIPAGHAYVSAQASAAAQALALRESVLRAKLARNANVFSVAQEAEQQGDEKLAARLYQRLALSRPRTDVTASAQNRLSLIQGAAHSKLQALEDELNAASGRGTLPSALQSTRIDSEKVLKVFAAIDKLAIEYAGVSSIENRIKDRSEVLRKQKQFAAILNEPVAKQLWTLGQKHENDQKRCCAFLVYEQAANLTPAPSAEQAAARLKQMQADAAIVAEARTCRNLQLCHEKYQRALSLKSSLPGRAREYFSQILEVAAPDSSIHQAAREQLALLR